MKHIKHISIIISFFVLQLLTLPLLFLFNELTTLVINFILSITIALWLYKDTLQTKWQLLKQQTTLSSVLLYSLGLSFANMLIRSLLLIAFQNYIDIDTLGQNQQSLELLLAEIPAIVFIALTVIQAPLFEELVFREAMNGWVNPNQRWLRYTMWIISTLLFAAMHVYSIQDYLLYLPLSISLLYMYVKYDNNIWGSILFHFVNNALSVALMFLIPSDTQSTAIQFIMSLIK